MFTPVQCDSKGKVWCARRKCVLSSPVFLHGSCLLVLPHPFLVGGCKAIMLSSFSWRSVIVSWLLRALLLFINILEASQALKKKLLRRDVSWQTEDSMRSSSRFYCIFPYSRKREYIQTRMCTTLLYFWENKRNLAVSCKASDIHIFFWRRHFAKCQCYLQKCGCFYFNLQISLLWIMIFPWFGY